MLRKVKNFIGKRFRWWGNLQQWMLKWNKSNRDNLSNNKKLLEKISCTKRAIKLAKSLFKFCKNHFFRSFY